MSLTWHGFWDIFKVSKKPEQYLYDEELYSIVYEKIALFLGNKALNKLTYDVFEDAYDRMPDLKDYFGERDENPEHININGTLKTKREAALFLMMPFLNKDPKLDPFESEKAEIAKIRQGFIKIPHMDRLQILKDIVLTVQKAGFPQANHILQYIQKLSPEA